MVMIAKLEGLQNTTTDPKISIALLSLIQACQSKNVTVASLLQQNDRDFPRDMVAEIEKFVGRKPL